MSEQFSKMFPMEDNIIIKIPVGTDIVISNNRVVNATGSTLYNSAKEFIDKLLKPIRGNFSSQLLNQGMEVEILEPGKQWQTGKIRCRVVFEFVTDELENNKISDNSISSLDELRNIKL